MGESLVLGVFFGGFMVVLAGCLWLLAILTGGAGEDSDDGPL